MSIFVGMLAHNLLFALGSIGCCRITLAKSKFYGTRDGSRGGQLGGRKQTNSKALLRAQPLTQMEDRTTKTLREFHITNSVRAFELVGY